MKIYRYKRIAYKNGKGNFYPEKDITQRELLRFYSSRLNTVEIIIHFITCQRDVLTSWADQVAAILVRPQARRS